MQHAIGDHALLADGRTAALLDPDGNVAWLCWPRIDSAPLLLSLLDEQRGGRFSLRPSAAHAVVESRRYHPDSLVLETIWRIGAQRLVIDDALLWQTPTMLTRRMRSEGGDVDVELRFVPAAGVNPMRVGIQGRRLLTSGGDGARLVVTSPAVWHMQRDAAVSRFLVTHDAGARMATLAGDASGAADPPPSVVDEMLGIWRSRLSGMNDAGFTEPAADALGHELAGALVRRSAAVLIGLRSRDGGIVAAPTTSLPQWPASARTWDYRYCWLRDASLAGTALVRAGLVDEAHALGDFLGGVIAETGPRAVTRVDGSPAPMEREEPALAGYRDARPVRFGNAAAEQPQLDVAGEVIELAAVLAANDALPDALARAVSRLADWTVAHWQEPDHGIWEIRGSPRHYTHSSLMAQRGLSRAVRLWATGRVTGDGLAWMRCGAAVRARMMVRSLRRRDVWHPAALELHDGGGGADAALALLPMVGFQPRDDPVTLATLDLIIERLDRGGVIDRYEGHPDELADPCAPFVFPTFWLAEALHRTGRDSTRYLRAAASTRGALDLFGECAEPVTATPLGNFPQVQSHAACILTLLAEPKPALSSSS